MAIFFDLDGTLLNPFPRYYRIHQLLTQRYQLPNLSYRAYVLAKRKKFPELFYLPDDFVEVKAQYNRQRYLMDEQSQFLACDRLYPAARLVLSRLAKTHVLCLVTVRWQRETLLQQLHDLCIADFFEFIVSAADVGKRGSLEGLKTEMLRLGRDKIGDFSSGYMVGDTEIDILAGKQCGLISVGKLGGMRLPRFVLESEPDYIVSHLRDLEDIIV